MTHAHEWITFARFEHAPTNDRDPIEHTAFMLLVCQTCAAADVFPAENFQLTTELFRHLLCLLLVGLNRHLIGEEATTQAAITALDAVVDELPYSSILPRVLWQARVDVAAGSPHDCFEWNDLSGRCALCGRALPPLGKE